LGKFNVPESVEILSDGCVAGYYSMHTVELEGLSRPKQIDKGESARCKLNSSRIPVFRAQIDGFAFVNCPLTAIKVAADNVDFIVEGRLLATSDG
jgi:hypothetical protein